MNSKKWTAAVLAFIITILVYLPALQNNFVNWDDGLFVYENLNIQSIDLKFFKWIFTSYHTADWFPVTWISHAIDYAVWGLNPMGHHLTNVILHGLNTFFVVMLVVSLIKIGGSGDNSQSYDVPVVAGAITGILFGIHPLHVESVAWVSERKDVLSSFFYLLSILSYVKYMSLSRPGAVEYAGAGSIKAGSKNYILCLLFFILALLSKPMAVTLPLILIILDFYPLERLSFKYALTSQLKVVIEKIPFLILSLASGIITIIVNKGAGSMSPVNFEIMGDRFIIAIRALSFYLFKMLWPTDLAPLYPYPKDISFFTLEYLGAFLLIACITVFCILSWKKQKVFSVAWAYYIVILLPVLGIIKSGEQMAADRYTYLSSIGPFTLIGLGAGLIYERTVSGAGRMILFKKYLLVPVIIVICILSVLTMKQIKIWEDSFTLWNYEMRLYNVSQPYISRGFAYAGKGQLDKALEDYNTAVSLDPDNVAVYSNRGIVHIMMKNHHAALEDFNMSIQMDPTIPSVFYNRGLIFLNLYNYLRAVDDFDAVIELDQEDALAYYNRGVAYEQLGENKQAVRDFQIAARLGYKNAQDYLGSLGLQWE